VVFGAIMAQCFLAQIVQYTANQWDVIAPLHEKKQQIVLVKPPAVHISA